MNKPQETSQHDLLPALVEAVKTTRATVAKTKRKLATRVTKKKTKTKTTRQLRKCCTQHSACGPYASALFILCS